MLMLSSLVTFALYLRQRAAHQPEVLGRLPPFSFTRHDGKPFGSADLEGRLWIADFIFTNCGGICPAMTARMNRLRKQVPGDVRFVSFSVDPVRDTAPVLARYAEPFEPGQQWSFLTGGKVDLYSLAVEGFKLEVFESDLGAPSPDGPFMHSGRFVLVDGERRIRGYYESGDEGDLSKLVADVNLLDSRWP